MRIKNYQKGENTVLDCREKILSDDFVDMITGEDWILGFPWDQLSDFCIQRITEGILAVYLERDRVATIMEEVLSYEHIPSLYVPLSTSALDAAGIFRSASQPVLNLQGQGVILAFADTGIDYTHPAFLDENGNSRILSIWDQTIQTGEPPAGMRYGTEYTREQINAALAAPDPQSLVPSVDVNGHGTYVAGVAAGSRVLSEGVRYQGAAPLAEIVAVKLKPAKMFLRDFYRIPQSAEVFQENDILFALRYFLDVQVRWGRPLVVCFTLGSNLGGHGGTSYLGKMLDNMAGRYQTAVVAAAGNEAARGHHYHGKTDASGAEEIMELQVGENEPGFTMEIWPDPSELMTVSVTSPSGQRTETFIGRIGVRNQVQFILEETVLNVNFWFSTLDNGNQIITLRFAAPAAGLWQIHVYSVLHFQGGFHAWLPAQDLIRPDTIFLRSDIDVTLTDPSAGSQLITVGAYNHVTDSIYLQSGRGFTRLRQVQPSLAAPGTGVDGPSSASVTGYVQRTGTSAAAAIAAGGAASVLTWGIVNGNLPGMTGTIVKYFLTMGAVRQNNASYPSEEWGYGKFNLYEVFDTLVRLL